MNDKKKFDREQAIEEAIAKHKEGPFVARGLFALAVYADQYEGLCDVLDRYVQIDTFTVNDYYILYIAWNELDKAMRYLEEYL